jgi:hypothetical protein
MLASIPSRVLHAAAVRVATMMLAAIGVAACSPAIVSTLPAPLTPAQMAELWVDPGRGRDLFWGVGGRRLAPDPSAIYRVIEIKTTGFSDGYTVIGPGDREWSVKFRPEAITEVSASRIVWGAGFHQPPVYLVEKWTAEDAPRLNPQEAARFREKAPDFHGLDTDDDWSFYQNPFVGTRQLAGLLVLQAMLGNSDLKDENNALYALDEPVEGARRWYVTRDVGHTFGRMGLLGAPRGDIEVFELTPFIKGVKDGRVLLQLGGRHNRLFDDITPADVRWICGLLDRLTDEQWQDAFRAGGFDRPTADRFIRRMKQKIAEGLALKG